MSFALRPDDASIQAALHRIARSELQAARKALTPGQGQGDGQTGGPTPDAVHALRKHTKKLRGLLRLVRPVFPGFAPANAALRDGARHLADLRDAEVRLATLQGITAALDTGCVPDFAEPLLRSEVAALRQPDLMSRLCAVLDADLACLRREVHGWRLSADGWAALAPGLGATWRACRHGHGSAARAHAQGTGAVPFHDWRKAVKHHWYQARLLEPLAPADLSARITAIDALAEDLGAHNDIDLLLLHLAGHPDRRLSSLAAEGPFLRAARAARAELARRSLAQGAVLFADRPRHMARRWQGWWDRWRVAACPR